MRERGGRGRGEGGEGESEKREREGRGRGGRGAVSWYQLTLSSVRLAAPCGQ